MNTFPTHPDQLIEMYRIMFRIRRFELKVNELFLRGLVPGTIHLYHGQEASGVGAISCLNQHDLVVTTHRPHGHAIAKGMDMGRLMAEILGRSGGCSQGKGGSMHIADVAHGIMPSIPIIGAGIPIAAGLAFAFQQNHRAQVVLSFFGDATINIGAFHEGVNLAAIWKLPVVFICENNLYGVSTSIKDSILVDQIADRSSAYGIPGLSLDGNDVEAVYAGVKQAVSRARNGEGPMLVETKTYRHGGHSRTDPATYRPKEEVEYWLQRDPLILCRQRLTERGWLSPQQCDAIEAEEQQQVNQAAEFAIASPEPNPDTALIDVYF